jgi:hypothetical protein
LIGPDGTPALGPGDATVAVQAPATAGRVTIVVADDVTVMLEPARYCDALRVTIDGVRSTMWRGCVLVDADLPDIGTVLAPPPIVPPSPPLPISIATGSIAIGAPFFVSPGVQSLG